MLQNSPNILRPFETQNFLCLISDYVYGDYRNMSIIIDRASERSESFPLFFSLLVVLVRLSEADARETYERSEARR